jgi:uridine phosphorylase
MQPMPSDEKERRQRIFNMRLSDDEGARLDKLSEHYGINAAELIRMLLKREEKAIATEAPTREHKPKRRTRAA